MRFNFDLALKNLKKRPGRTVALVLLIAFLAFTIFSGSIIVLGLQNGLDNYESRLGADIVVVPNSAVSHGSLDDIMLQGITGNYYMRGADYTKIKNMEGINKVTAQFFLASAKASCCSTRVQIIGFDPETDFLILPWIQETYSKTINDGDIIVGANLNIPLDKRITFYNKEYTVVAQLAKTGTGLDSAVYTNMATIQQMAQDASTLTESDAFADIDIKTAVSAVFIKVKQGYEITSVSDDINIHVTKVKATAAKSMVSDIASGLSSVSKIIGILIAVMWVLSIVVLFIAFVMINNERKKEFALLRIVGASGNMVGKLLITESSLLCGFGAVVGLILSMVITLPLSNTLKTMLNLPYLLPKALIIVLIGLASIIATTIVGILSAYITSNKFAKQEAGLLLKEDA